jgi:hypothetical protein
MCKSRYLIHKYCPIFYGFLEKRKYLKWVTLDSRLENQLLTKSDVKTSLIRLLFEIEVTGNPFLKGFSDYFDQLLKEIIEIIPNKETRIWDSINGKFDNIEDWNSLNPIGELSVLRKFINSGLFDLIEIEIEYSNNRPKDFAFRQKSNGKKKVIEVVNIHIPVGMIEQGKIKNYLLDKVQKKIAREITGITDLDELKRLFILPVVWYLDMDILTSEYDFFNDFNRNLGSNYGMKHPTLGFCTFVKYPDNTFIFGEASSIIALNKN